MELKHVDLELLKDFAFSPNELIELGATNDEKFINYKCLTNEGIMPTIKAIPLDELKKAREEVEDIGWQSCRSRIIDGKRVHTELIDRKDVLEILDRLIVESEG